MLWLKSGFGGIGWLGLGNGSYSDAINQAITPFTDSLFARFPNATLRTDGENVGLPEGQMGNSEVGHMNLGAGSVVWQMLAKINKAFDQNEVAKTRFYSRQWRLPKRGIAASIL